MAASVRRLEELPIDLTLFDTKKRGEGVIGSCKTAIGETWKHNIRRVGGFWMATSEWRSGKPEMIEMFLEGMMRQVKESLGSAVTWEGFAGVFELTMNGATFVRDWTTIFNRAKANYTRVGDNLFTNGSAETGAWADYNTPTTNAQSTTWVSSGEHSEHIVSDGASDGATIETGLAVVANVEYECRVAVNVVSGTWTLAVYQDDGSSTVLASVQTDGTGQMVLHCTIPDTSAYAGNVGAHIYAAGVGEIYADGGVLRKAPLAAETTWYEDAASQAEYGVMETVLSLGEMSDEAADASVQRYLAEHAYPKTRMSGRVISSAIPMDEMKLKITWFGHIWTASNRYASVSGTDDADDHVSALVAECEFVDAGIVEANTMQYQIDTQTPSRVWDCLRSITEAGDSTGDRWGLGCYENKLVEYREWDSEAGWRMQNGQAVQLGGGMLDGWQARPGLMVVDDIPMGPAGPSIETDDDPRVVVVDEVEFDAAGWLAGKSGLVLSIGGSSGG